MVCYADDRDVVIRYSVMTNQIKNETSICENSAMMILNFFKNQSFTECLFKCFLQSITATLGYKYK